MFLSERKNSRAQVSKLANQSSTGLFKLDLQIQYGSQPPQNGDGNSAPFFGGGGREGTLMSLASQLQM